MNDLPVKNKPYGALKIVSSLTGGIICGFLLFFLIGLSMMEAAAKRPLLYILLMILGTVLAAGIFFLIFLKSPSNKNMFGRMSICTGILILLLPPALFINLTMVGQESVINYFPDFLKPFVLRNTIVFIVFCTLCMFIGIGFIIQAYFLLRRAKDKQQS